MTNVGEITITIKKKYAAALGAERAEVLCVWHGIDGEIIVKDNQRHITKLTLRSIDQKIYATLPSGSTIWNSPLAVLAVRALAHVKIIKVARVEDGSTYVRLGSKFNASKFIEGVS